MNFYTFAVVFILSWGSGSTVQKDSVPENNSFCGECYVGVLLQSRARHVSLVCGPDSKLCPSNILNRNLEMSWTILDKNLNDGTTATMTKSDARDFCVIAGDNITDLTAVFEADRNCWKEKIILTFPGGGVDPWEIQNLFYLAWGVGITDIVIVSSDSLCRVYTYFPFKGWCFNVTPFLIASWERNSTCMLNESFVPFPKKISSLHSCGISVIVEEHSWYYWGPFVEFLKVAMNSTFVISHANGTQWVIPRSTIRVHIWYPYPRLTNFFALPSYFYSMDYVYAVPRVLVTSVDWFRLFSELSYPVWIGLMIALMASIGTLYFFMKGGGDLAYAVLFSVQPLLGNSWEIRGDFLSVHGRIFITSWLFFCLVVSSSYLCTLLSVLTVPSTEGAIKSFDDLRKSELPVHASIVNYTIEYFEEGPYFKPIRNKLVLTDPKSFLQMVQKDRQDIAYVIIKDNFAWHFSNTSYRLLPEVIRTMYHVLVVISKPTPFEEFFRVAVLRAMGVGALDKVIRDNKIREFLFSRRQMWEENGPYPLTLESFEALFVIWLFGCALSLAAFILELIVRFCGQ